MRILPISLGFFSALISLAAVQAAPTPATILIGGRVVPFQVKPFVGPDGQVLAPVDAVQLLGAKFTPNQDGTVTVTSAGGRQFTTPYTPVSGRYCVPFQKVATALGGIADWQPTTATLTVRARLQMVRQDDKTLTIYTSYPIYYSVKRIDAPERLYVDLFGLDLATTPASIPSTDGNVTHIRSGQINPQTVRITIDLKRGLPFRVLSGIQTNQVQVALGDANSKSPNSPSPNPVPMPPVAVVNPPVAALPAHAGAVTITNVDYKVVSPALTQITVSTTGPAKYRTEALDNPHRLAFDLAGASLAQGLQVIQSVNDPVIKAIRVGKLLTPQTAFGRVVLDLSRMVGFSVDSRRSDGEGMSYVINVITTDPAAPVAVVPPVVPVSPLPVRVPSNASLAGKIICIDPGHGSQDSGAVGLNGVREKDLVLSIGRRLRDTLVQNGATVVMTRSDDGFLPVAARPQFAIQHNADYYISVHCDSSGGVDSHQGTTVYYHARNTLCRLMAMDISKRVAEVSGIARDGVKSDTIRFTTGFGVLRGSPMPAVLVECGYVNSSTDLPKLRDDATQQKIADGITAGLRDFIADQIRLLHSAQAQALPAAPQVMPAAIQRSTDDSDNNTPDTSDSGRVPN